MRQLHRSCGSAVAGLAIAAALSLPAACGDGRGESPSAHDPVLETTLDAGGSDTGVDLPATGPDASPVPEAATTPGVDAGEPPPDGESDVLADATASETNGMPIDAALDASVDAFADAATGTPMDAPSIEVASDVSLPGETLDAFDAPSIEVASDASLPGETLDAFAADTRADTRIDPPAPDANVAEASAADVRSDGTPAADASLDAADVSPTDAAACVSTFPPPSGKTVASPPLLAHWEQPADKTLVALTFDDGPDDAAVTDRVLDVLAAEGVKATFFVNTRVRADVRSSSVAQHTLARIVAEGHELGNHTAHHADLTAPTTDVDGELSLAESDLRAAMACLPPLALIRAPYGSPYIDGTQAAIDLVAPTVARHGVHIGWSIESLDWQCVGKTPSCWVPRVLGRIDLGRRGSILMHSTEPVTADGLPLLIAGLRSRGLHFVTAGALVRAKYGASAQQLTADYRASH